MYNNDKMMRIVNIRARVDGFNRNMVLSNSKAFGFSFGPARLIATINATVKKKEYPMQRRKGISYLPSLFGYAVYNQVFVPNHSGA